MLRVGNSGSGGTFTGPFFLQSGIRTPIYTGLCKALDCSIRFLTAFDSIIGSIAAGLHWFVRLRPFVRLLNVFAAGRVAGSLTSRDKSRRALAVSVRGV